MWYIGELGSRKMSTSVVLVCVSPAVKYGVKHVKHNLDDFL